MKDRNLAARRIDAHWDAELTGFFQHGIHTAFLDLGHLSHDLLALFGIAHVSRLQELHNRVRWPRRAACARA